MNKNHARAHVAHHLSYFVPVDWHIAVDFALAAARFVHAFRAPVEALTRIIEQGEAVGAHLVAMRRMMLVAIYGNHLANHQLLSFYAFHKLLHALY